MTSNADGVDVTTDLARIDPARVHLSQDAP